jgi:hypothetical protein
MGLLYFWETIALTVPGLLPGPMGVGDGPLGSVLLTLPATRGFKAVFSSERGIRELDQTCMHAAEVATTPIHRLA